MLGGGARPCARLAGADGPCVMRSATHLLPCRQHHRRQLHEGEGWGVKGWKEQATGSPSDSPPHPPHPTLAPACISSPHAPCLFSQAFPAGMRHLTPRRLRLPSLPPRRASRTPTRASPATACAPPWTRSPATAPTASSGARPRARLRRAAGGGAGGAARAAPPTARVGLTAPRAAARHLPPPPGSLPSSLAASSCS